MKLADLKPKRPQLKRKASSGSKSSIKAPKFAVDLYADLRDRRLLPLVALLLVAIVAAPILLASKDDEETPTPVPPVAGGATVAAQASFAVVPETATLRDYRTRLRHRQARDPFRQPPAPAKPSSAGESEPPAAGSEGTDGESVSVEAEVEEPATPKTTTKVVVQSKVLGYEIDTRAGYVGYVKPHKGIAPTTKLPSPKKPVIVFTGFSKDNKRALFLMSSNVTAYYGKVRCALDKQACQLVELAPGKSATFAYGYGEARYKITLQKIVPVVGTRRSEATVTTGGGRDNGGIPAGE